MTDTTGAAAMLPDRVRVLGGPGQGEWTEQRSRFLGFALPADDEATAREAIADIARRYHNARHVCHAWRLGAPPPPRETRHDDGEPAGTGGEPLLTAIRRCDLTNTVVVVVRYFGGIKLGTGGLARAYGTAADLALAAAPRADLPLGRRFHLRFAYPLRRSLEHIVRLRGGHVTKEVYGVDIAWDIWLPHSGCAGFVETAHEATAGAVHPEALDPP